MTTLKDPRRSNASHPLEAIVFSLVVAVICGADGFVQAERIAQLRRKFIARYVELPHGIPAHDTMARVIGLLTPDNFVDAFVTFMSRLTRRTKDEILNIDGKTLRAAVNKLSLKHASAEDQVHMINAFSALRGVVVGQLRSSAVANEIAGAQDLLRLINVHGCTITMDAAHTCRKTLEMIAERGANVVVGVKSNSRKLLNDIVAAFQAGAYQLLEQTEHGHGRVEHRKYAVVPASGESTASSFATLRAFIRVERQRIFPKGQISKPRISYYATSLDPSRIEYIAECVRQRWAIENRLHYVLDVAFDEDKCRVRAQNAAENLSRVRHLSLNLLNEDKTERGGIATKRQVALVDDMYLARILQLDSPA
jgi:predicted transposase YbfD/YdcC